MWTPKFPYNPVGGVRELHLGSHIRLPIFQMYLGENCFHLVKYLYKMSKLRPPLIPIRKLFRIVRDLLPDISRHLPSLVLVWSEIFIFPWVQDFSKFRSRFWSVWPFENWWTKWSVFPWFLNRFERNLMNLTQIVIDHVTWFMCKCILINCT